MGKQDDTRPANIIGPRLRLARTGHGPSRRFYTQAELADRIPSEVRLDRFAIARLEGQTRVAKDYEILALADALDVSVTWLLGTDSRAES